MVLITKIHILRSIMLCLRSSMIVLSIRLKAGKSQPSLVIFTIAAKISCYSDFLSLIVILANLIESVADLVY